MHHKSFEACKEEKDKERDTNTPEPLWLVCIPVTPNI
jgi:hypothetical protein